LNGASPVSASIGESFEGIGTTLPNGTICAARIFCAGMTLRSSTAITERTDRFRAVTSTGTAKRSLCFSSSHCFASFVRTRANEPLSFSPRSSTLSLPLASPSRTSRSAAARSWNHVAPPSSGE
jgi:hypothetical protein